MKQFILLLLLFGMITVTFSSCIKEKKSDDIITKISPKPQISHSPQQLTDFSYKKEIEWMDAVYTITIRRYADKDLPLITDEDGTKYFDNKIDLKILRKDGTTFYSRSFSKNDFKSFTNNQYGKHGILVGFMFDKVDGNYLRFGASIGSPDPNSDEYIPIDVIINNMGDLHITNAAQLDTNSDQNKTTNEIEEAEKEGI